MEKIAPNLTTPAQQLFPLLVHLNTIFAMSVPVQFLLLLYVFLYFYVDFKLCLK